MAFEVGQIVEGKITGITKFGVFVALGEGQTGMVHISEVSNEYVNDLHDHVKEGEIVKVKVLNIDQRGRIGLSMSQAVAEQKKTVSFEDMLSKYKQESDEKIIDLKKSFESKRGGFSRRSFKKY